MLYYPDFPLIFTARNEKFQFIWKKTVLKRMSYAIFNMKKFDLDES